MRLFPASGFPALKLSRRGFITYASVSTATLLAARSHAEAARQWLDPRRAQATPASPGDAGTRTVYSACLGCNSRCGTRMTVQDGTLATVAGNPYHPYNMGFNPLEYHTPARESLKTPASVCGKAHDAPNYVNNPYRLVRPLKRSGPRGSGRFEPIEWERLIEEVVAGGRLFAHLGEERRVPGLSELNSDRLIDPKAPELGPVRNGFVFIAGRDQSGRQEFTTRFVKEALGSVNRVGHTDICGLGFRMGNFALTEKKEVELKADPLGAEYLLLFGANIYEATQPGINAYGALVASRSAAGKTRFTIIDPRATNASAHADDWIAIKPGQDGAFAMGMIRWMMENARYHKSYLGAPNPKAAAKIGHGSYSNATHLVVVEPGHRQEHRFLRMSDLDPSLTGDKGSAFVVLGAGDAPLPFDVTEFAQLDREATLAGPGGTSIRVKTCFRLLGDSARRFTVDQYAASAGVEPEQIVRVAREFTSHGTRAAVCQYHGAGNYASGVHAAYAVAVLNALIGSVDRKGGYLKGSGAAGNWNRGAFDLKSFPSQVKARGVMLSREGARYEKSSEYRKKKEAGGSGYPARRPWFPFTLGGLCVETLSGIDQGYPYGCQVLFSYFFNPVYSIPGGQRFARTLKDPAKVPLHVSIDVCINESNLYADYIVPDITYPEGHYAFLTPHAPALKFTAVRTPAIEPLTGRTVDGRPFGLETFLIDLALAAKLPGFGPGAIPSGDGALHPLSTGEDYYLRGIANLAESSKLPEASPEEVAFVEHNYPVARYKGMLSAKQWRRSCYLLARGGAFTGRYQDDFEGENHKAGVKRVALYNEELATCRNFLTGAFIPGLATYLPPEDAAGNVLEQADRDYPFALVTHKMNLHAQSRTTSHRWSMEVFPENHVVMHRDDAARLGIGDGEKVRLVSSSNLKGVVGTVRVSSLVRPGCLAVSFHYGHTQMGASSLPVTGADQVFLGKDVAGPAGLKGDSRLGAGILPNDLGRMDEALGGLPLVDVVAGIPDFSSTRVKVEKLL